MISQTFLRGALALLVFVLPCSQSVHGQTTPPEVDANDPGYQRDVAERLGLRKAWGLAQTMESSWTPDPAGTAAVLVLDSSIDFTHPELRDAAVPSLNRDFTTDHRYVDSTPQHGTAVASKIAGGWNNAYQATSVVPGHLNIIGGKIFPEGSDQTGDDVMRAGFEYGLYLKTVLHINLKAINLSAAPRSPGLPSEELKAVISQLRDNDVLVGITTIEPRTSGGSFDPKDYGLLSLIGPEFPNLFAVSPLASDGQNLTPTYPWNPKATLFAAPGENIKQAGFPSNIATLTASGSGSSVAVPETLGVALFVSVYGKVSPTVGLWRVKGTAIKTAGISGKIGYGIPDAYAALTTNFTPPATGLSLLTQTDTPLAAAVEHVTRQWPIPVTTTHNFSADSRGRAMFLAGADVLLARAPALELKDLSGSVVRASIEHMAIVPDESFAQVTIRIPDGITPGEYWASLVDGTVRSNSVLVVFQ